MKNPLRKQQLIDLGMMITGEDDQCYAGILKHKQLNIQFDLIYNFDGLLAVEFEKNPLMMKPVFTEKQFMKAINDAHKVYSNQVFDKPLLMQINLQYQIEFSNGQFHLKYNLDPVTSLVAFSIAAQSLQSLIEKDLTKEKKQRLTAQQKQKHVFAISLLKELEQKLAIVVKEQAERKSEVKIDVVPESELSKLKNIK